MVDPMTIGMAWMVGLYGFAVRWRWVGAVGYFAVTAFLFLPILR